MITLPSHARSHFTSTSHFQKFISRILLFTALLLQTTTAAFVRSYQCSGVDQEQFLFSSFLTNSSFNEDTGDLSFQLRTFALDEIVDINSKTNMFTTLHVVLYYMDEVIADDYLRFCDYIQVERSTHYIVPSGVFEGLDFAATSSIYLNPLDGPFGSEVPTQSVRTINDDPLALLPTSSTMNLIGITTATASSMSTISPSLYSSASAVISSNNSSLQSSIRRNSSSSALSSSSSSSSSNTNGKTTTTDESDPDFLPVAIQKRDLNIITVTEPQVLTSLSTVYQQATTTSSSPFQSSSSSSPSSSHSSSQSSTTSSSCPVLKNNEVIINYTKHVGHRSRFGAYKIQLSVISPSANHTVIGCTHAYVNLKLDNKLPTTMVAFYATILGLILFSNFLNMMISPYQDSTDPFLKITAAICNAPLLNQISPIYTDFWQYLQYMFFMAALNLQYPGFFIPLMSSMRWVGLAVMSHGVPGACSGGVYETIFSGGLKALTLDSYNSDASESWRNFLWIAAT
ncbi:unnamed protein product [Ambrosiozyma monospora]|uniref:Unnamed protein product n=1 Tax=Ambrosiozyma monospora TaxID=43982 RepID=A0ACB5TD74_AMBMO|nr:unnamed protein product [Ambrosiozyma monospora]